MRQLTVLTFVAAGFLAACGSDPAAAPRTALPAVCAYTTTDASGPCEATSALEFPDVAPGAAPSHLLALTEPDGVPVDLVSVTAGDLAITIEHVTAAAGDPLGSTTPLRRGPALRGCQDVGSFCRGHNHHQIGVGPKMRL